MQNFIIKELNNTDIKSELENIGFDLSYSSVAKNKFLYKNFKIFDLTCAQANILKQTALSVGADCATHKQVITGQIETSSVILGGSHSQLEKISKKLQHQPFKLKILGEQLEKQFKELRKISKIMGILNVTQNSFSDGGEFFEYESAIKQLNKLIDDGADIIDIGAESTKPYSKSVPADFQLEKILPILKYIEKNNINIPVSIDTRSSIVASECIKNGANIINDVSGFDYDSNMINVLSQARETKIIVQHSLGTPENMQDNPIYSNLMDDIFLNLSEKVSKAVFAGIKKENIVIDPGIGFGKTVENNFEIIKRWKELRAIGCEILIGLSRKSLLQINDASNEEKDIYTLALNSILINENIDYIRVHNVKMHKKLIKMLSF